ncbi:unnamed protein product [Notodromas monacha]|uniref:PDZ domain-containing protein n=1 Tax=Notodromas monacha TaxID=399045 RepID=A0A7R9BET6_9CRUS|nr:unnamed protein product [Notodromas monacha]CAG0913173.1 unnamed protein product [Notodromas monacha]
MYEEGFAAVIHFCVEKSDAEVPWGIELAGGIDQGQPFTIAKIYPGAWTSQRLEIGDRVLQLQKADLNTLTNSAANRILEASAKINKLEMTIGKARRTISSLSRRGVRGRSAAVTQSPRPTPGSGRRGHGGEWTSTRGCNKRGTATSLEF